MSDILKKDRCKELTCTSISNNSWSEKNEFSLETNIRMDLHSVKNVKPTQSGTETVSNNFESAKGNHVTFQRVFKVMYVGYAVLDKRYTQPMFPWLIAEIKRHALNNEEQIFIEITEQFVKAVKCDNNSVIFEHKLQSVCKFSQSALHPECFTYITREDLSGPSAYHVFQAHDENSVLELFTAIREVSKEMHHQQNVSSFSVKTASGVTLDSVIKSCSQYEVLYLGRIKVAGKKAPPNFIDETVEKFRIFELEKSKNYTNFPKRRRHGSGASISSLPHNFDFKKPNESEPQIQFSLKEKDLSTSSGVSSSESISYKSLETHINCDINPLLQSPLSPICTSDNIDKFSSKSFNIISHSQSMDISNASQSHKDLNTYKSNFLIPPSSLITHTQSLDAPGCVDIVRDLRDSDPSVKLRDRVRSCSGDNPRTKQTSLPAYYRSEGLEMSDVQRPRAYTSPFPSEHRQSNRTMLFLIGATEICLIGTDKKQMLLSIPFSDIAHCSQGIRHLDHFGFICRETTLSGSDCYCGYIFRCQTEKVVDEMMQTLKQAFRQAHQQYQKHPTKSSPTPKIFMCDSCPMHWFHRLCCDVEGISADDTHLKIFEKLGNLPDSVKEEIIMKFQKIQSKDAQEQNEILMMLLREMAEHMQRSHTHTTNPKKTEVAMSKERGSKLDSFREKARKSLSNSFETFLKFTNREEGKESFVNLQASNDHLPAVKDIDSRSYRESSCDNERFLSGQTSPISSRPRSSTFSSSRDVKLNMRKSSRQENVSQNRPIMNVQMKAGNQKNPPLIQVEDSPKGSWRQAIFHRVQTPAHGQKSSDQEETEVDGKTSNNSKVKTKKTRAELRALWKKAIIEQILLIRMEKENRKLQVNQDAVTYKRMKLNYEEITPCIKSILLKWEEILNDSKLTTLLIDRGKLTELVKAGVPRHKRGEIWQFLAEQQGHFQTLTDEEKLNIPYDELLKQLTSHQHSILIDIGII